MVSNKQKNTTAAEKWTERTCETVITRTMDDEESGKKGERKRFAA